jgi:Protein of unknown function (DUF2752)
MRDLALLRRLAAAALVASVAIPSALIAAGPTICPFRAATGLPCPSCGMTRSWSAMGHGRVRDASGFHLMGPVTYLLAAGLVAVGDRRVSRLLDERSRARATLGAFGVAWIVAWLWRLTRGSDG